MTDWPIKGLCDHCGAPYNHTDSCLYCGKERWDELTPEKDKVSTIMTLASSGIISTENARMMLDIDLEPLSYDIADMGGGYVPIMKSWWTEALDVMGERWRGMRGNVESS